MIDAIARKLSAQFRKAILSWSTHLTVAAMEIVLAAIAAVTGLTAENASCAIVAQLTPTAYTPQDTAPAASPAPTAFSTSPFSRRNCTEGTSTRELNALTSPTTDGVALPDTTCPSSVIVAFTSPI